MPRPMRRLLLLVPLLLLLLPGLAPLHAQDEPLPPAGPETLHPGDRVQLQVWRNAELSGTMLVAEDGTLQHPLFRQVAVAGVPVAEARERVAAFLSRYDANPQFVFVPEYLVYVGGAVRDQNQHFLPQVSVGQAIVRAGGSTAPNDDYRVRLVRDGTSWYADLDGAEGAARLLQQPVRSGDQVLVEERPTFMRTVVSPTLQVLQTVTSLISTYVFFDAIFGN